MKSKLVVAARILLGLIFFVFGLNFFLHFIPTPPMSGPPGAFAGAMIATGYLFVLVKVTEVVSGAMLLVGRYVPLALAVLAPVVNIVAFHAFLAPPRHRIAARRSCPRAVPGVDIPADVCPDVAGEGGSGVRVGGRVAPAERRSGVRYYAPHREVRGDDPMV